MVNIWREIKFWFNPTKSFIDGGPVKKSCQICPKCGSVNPVKFKREKYVCKVCKSANKNTDFKSKST